MSNSVIKGDFNSVLAKLIFSRISVRTGVKVIDVGVPMVLLLKLHAAALRSR